MAAIHETAVDLHRVGGMDQTTMHKFDALCLTPIEEMTPARIRSIRTKEQASQTVFAAYLPRPGQQLQTALQTHGHARRILVAGSDVDEARAAQVGFPGGSSLGVQAH